MHAMTIDPKTGLPIGESPPASTAAVLSLACGLLLCLGPLTGLPAIIAGVVARKAVKDDPTAVGGGGLAVAGIILGAFNLVIFLVVGFIFLLSLIL